MASLNLGILASHGGSNLQAIIDACSTGKLDARICVVISNNSKSLAIRRAREHGIPHYHLTGKTHPSQEQLDEAIVGTLKKHSVDLIILAGYLKRLGGAVLREYPGKVLITKGKIQL